MRRWSAPCVDASQWLRAGTACSHFSLDGAVPWLGAGINAVALIYWLLTLKSGAPERCAVPANQ
ncbi:hypothetical protein C1884_04615 [Pseudomonas sp. GW460-R15]|nr:hypothetical protein C1887_12770 [Pseudomonas sp. GW456-R21]POA69937.1 hypothetical protein C1884_04615 [Pseudomonas sp. GW460-R15]